MSDQQNRTTEHLQKYAKNLPAVNPLFSHNIFLKNEHTELMTKTNITAKVTITDAIARIPEMLTIPTLF